MTKVDELWKKLLQASDVEDYEHILRSKEEIDEILAEQGGTQQNEQQVNPNNPNAGATV